MNGPVRGRLVQLALDLWDAVDLQPKPGETPAIQAPTAIKPEAPQTDAALRHPQANRRTALQGVAVDYLLQRARRRSIGFRVDGDGLSVRAPNSASIGAIESALQAKAGWIVRKLAEQRDYQRRLEGARIAWGDGARLPYLGAPLAVVLDGAHRGAQLAPAPQEGGAPATLHVPLARSANPEQVRDAVQAWLMRQARAHFTGRLEHFAPLLQVRWTRLALSSAQSRWGSARADGSIRLNWRLMHFSPAVIDYVVAHELAHLRVMDHSPRFWDTVATVVPDYAALRQRLRDEPTPPWR
ncbi:SprT family zinc-dependent metalloprotease [Pulveribacter sp.]|uniref:M48 family metallopeptidase n=1 Tax=Pulveribacter sp. TaxID=2678893 RepID=UPI0028975311|nr:SprT family zinc-dependent metalloprotease [Pulveribacter sp.]